MAPPVARRAHWRRAVPELACLTAILAGSDHLERVPGAGGTAMVYLVEDLRHHR